MASKKKKHQAAGRVPTGLAPIAPGTRGISRIPLSAVLARNLFPYPAPLSSSPTTVSTPVSLLSQRISVPQQPPILGGSLAPPPTCQPLDLAPRPFPICWEFWLRVTNPIKPRHDQKRIHLFFLRVCGCVFPCFRHQPSSLETLVCPLINNQPLGPDPTRLGPLLHRPPTHLILDSVLHDPTPASQRVTHSLILSRQTVSMIDPREWNREREQTKKKTCPLTHQPFDSRAILDSFIHSLFTVSSSSCPRPQARCTFALSISSQVPETQRGRGIESYSPPHHHHNLLLCTVVPAGFVSLFHLFFGQGPFPFHTPSHPPPKPLSSCFRLPGPATT